MFWSPIVTALLSVCLCNILHSSLTSGTSVTSDMFRKYSHNPIVPWYRCFQIVLSYCIWDVFRVEFWRRECLPWKTWSAAVSIESFFSSPNLGNCQMVIGGSILLITLILLCIYNFGIFFSLDEESRLDSMPILVHENSMVGS